MDARVIEVTERTRLRRLRQKGSLERADLDAVLGAGFVCHLAVVLDGTPLALPTGYGYDAPADVLYLHGSVASRSVIEAPGQTVSVTVTHIDGLVLARSLFEHSVNYRCAVVIGVPRVVTDPSEKLHGLRMLSDQAAPGQWDYARRPSGKELAATTLLALGIAEASVKLSTDYPDDADSPDGELPVWAGKLPLVLTWGTPEPDPDLRAGIPLPPHISSRVGARAQT